MGIIDNSMIKIEIDGIEFNAKRNSKIIEVADEVGIYIPRFCYHKKLSIAANCRMCLVEIEKAPKLFPACATPIADGMKIFTNTEKVINAQRAVMEFLLINHPLDCPICDQGGECELQDLTIGYGCSTSRFLEQKRSFNDYDFGPLISTDVTRCILCSRCVRFCEEISGTEELGIINRGSNSRIFIFLKKYLSPGLSGNVIDLCPVGALTAKPSKFKTRPWELVQHSFISYHDCIGSNLYVHVFKDKVIRVVPRRNELLNETWISDRDRFSYEGLYSEDRIKTPMIKQNGKWKSTSWSEAITYSFDNIINIKNKFGPNQLASLASPNSTVEELFVLQKFIRTLGSNNLDHRLKQTDFSEQEKFPIFTGMNINIDQVDKLDFVFLIGSNIVKEQPILALKLRKVINNGGKVFVLNPIDFNFSMNLTKKYIFNPRYFVSVLTSIVKMISLKLKVSSFYGMEKLFKSVKTSNIYLNIVNSFLNSHHKLIVLGSYSYCSPDYSKIVSLSSLLAKLTKSFFGVMTDGANSSGAWLTGFIPHRLPGGKSISKNIGLDTLNIFFKKLKAYILFGLEIEYDSFYSHIAIDALKNSNFVLTFSAFKSDMLLNLSDVILPIATSYENSGTFINVSGESQTFSSIIPCKYETKLGWKAIVEVANNFKLSGFCYKNISIVLNEFNLLSKVKKKLLWDIITVSDLSTKIVDDKIIVPFISEYNSDSLVRRALSLQKINNESTNILKCNKYTYNDLKLKNDYLFINTYGQNKKYFILIDDTISNNSIFIEINSILNYTDFGLPYESIIFNKV